MGNDAISSGLGSVSLGFSTRSNGWGSTAIGNANSASHNFSTCIGNNNISFGVSSVCIGENNRAVDYSTSIGYRNIANRNYSTALGKSNETNGESSTVFGMQNKTFSFGETVFGIGATNYTTTSGGSFSFTSANNTDRLFVIGNAIDLNSNNQVDSAERSNAMVILKNGNTAIGNISPTERLHVDGRLRLVDGTQGANKILSSNATGVASWITIDSILKSKIGNGLYFHNTANMIRIGGVLTENTTISGVGFNFTHDLTSTGDYSIVESSSSVPSLFVKGNDGTATDGFVGIGTNTPSEKLDINGKTKTINFQMTNGAGANKILKSDASGNASWDSITANEVYAWGISGNSGTNPTTHFMGTTDSIDLVFKNNNNQNMRLFANGSWLVGDSMQGAGTKTFFDITKGAFRTGNVSSSRYWDKDSLGQNSFASGVRTRAKGNTSTAMGSNTYANGHTSVALGNFTNANGDYSTAMGSGTDANGDYSTAMGQASVVNGTSSTAMGINTIANGNASLVIGQFNDTIVSPSLMITGDNPLFIIGNGVTNTSRKNAVVVQYDGDFGINNNNPLKKLHILGDGGKSNATSSTDAEFVLEEAGDELYMSILSDTNRESGYQFGNQFSGAHAGIYYNSGGNTFDMRFRTNGNNTRMTIDKDGQVGIGTTTPNSNLETTGSLAAAIQTTTASITLNENHHTIILTSGTPTVTLPAASTCSRRMYVIVNQTSTTRSISSYLGFSGVANNTIIANSSITIQSDGTNWYRIQ